jgi:hypothetical protein
MGITVLPTEIFEMPLPTYQIWVEELNEIARKRKR